jgi:chromosomal replication initiation ATPase DnaA
MNEIKLKKDYMNIKEKTLSDIEKLIDNQSLYSEKNKEKLKEVLREVDFNTINTIGDFISSIFGVDRADMLSSDKTTEITHARWMWWLAMYFMLHKSYRMIAILTSLENGNRNPSIIANGVCKLQEEMKVNSDLRRKWEIIRQMIYLGKHPDNYHDPFSEGYRPKEKIKISKPKNIEIEIIDEKSKL